MFASVTTEMFKNQFLFTPIFYFYTPGKLQETKYLAKIGYGVFKTLWNIFENQ